MSLDSPVGLSRPTTDAGNAERLADRFGSQFRYCPQLGGWFYWTGSYWALGDTGITEAAIKVARAIPGEALRCENDDMRSKLIKHAIKSESAGAINAMISIARGLPPFAVDASAFDSDPMDLNVKNGTIDLHTGQLHPHSPLKMHTQVANVTFDADAACPIWDRFIVEVLPDPEVRGFVQRLAGYCLTGLTNERAFIVFYGSGDNGKSVVLTTLYRLLGDYGLVPKRNLVTSGDSEQHDTRIADLKGKRLAAMSESTKGRRLDESLVKNLTGDEPITANRMRCDSMTFTMTAKLIFAVNDRPKVDADSTAVWNRLREVPFAVTIPKEQIDRQLLAKLAGEFSGILNWCLAGLAEWRVKGLGTAAAIETATAEYRAEGDDVARFILERYDRDPLGRVPRASLKTAFAEWANENGAVDLSSNPKAFAGAIRRQGVGEHSSCGERFWKLRAREQSRAPIVG